MSQPPAPDFGFEWGDKIHHACAFGLMMLFVFRAVRWLFPSYPLSRQLLYSLLFCIFYGATDEFHQYFVPGRSSEVLDWVADTVGASLTGVGIRLTINTSIAGVLYGTVRTSLTEANGQ